MANNKTEKVFKISDLAEIDTSRIDNNDSFLITDYHQGKHYTKRISMKKLMNVIVNNPDLISAILADESGLDQSIQEKVDNKINESFDLIDGGNALSA